MLVILETKQTFSLKILRKVETSMKITVILLNTTLYTTEPIIVRSVQTEICSKFLSLPRWIVYFLKLPWKRKLK